MRVADFFCGGGGFSEGFRQAGFEIVFAVDKWEPAVNTYKGNKPGVNVRLDDVIRISNAAGALSVMKVGGRYSVPTKDEMKELFHEFR